METTKLNRTVWDAIDQYESTSIADVINITSSVIESMNPGTTIPPKITTQETTKPNPIWIMWSSTEILIIFLCVIFIILILFVLLYCYVIKGMKHRPAATQGQQALPPAGHPRQGTTVGQSAQTSPQGVGQGAHAASDRTVPTTVRSQKSLSGSANGEKQRNIFAHPERQLAVDQSVRASPRGAATGRAKDENSDREDSGQVGMLGLIANLRDTLKDTAK